MTRHDSRFAFRLFVREAHVANVIQLEHELVLDRDAVVRQPPLEPEPRAFAKRGVSTFVFFFFVRRVSSR